MVSQELHAKALEALVALNAAIKNIRLYPPASAMVQKSVERVLSFLETIFQSQDELAVAESEKSLLVSGKPLSEKEQQKPQVTAFIGTLLDFGLKSLVLKQGITLAELETLLQTLSRKAEEVQGEGGLQAVLASSNLPHVVLDEKVYMAVDQDQELMASMGITGEEIVKFIASGKAASDQEMVQLKELARDPAWVANVFSAGIKQLQGGGDSTGTGMASTLQRLVDTFEDLTDEKSKAALSEQAAAAVVGQNDESLIPVLARDYEGQLGKALFSQILARMPDEQFERIVIKLKALSTEGDQTASLAYQNIAVSEKGRRLGAILKAPAAKDGAVRKQSLQQIKVDLKSLVQGELAPLDNPDFLKELPGAVVPLIKKGKADTAASIAERLATGLDRAAPQSRPGIYRAMQAIAQRLPQDRRAALAARTRNNLLNWIQAETTLSPEYKAACEEIKQQAIDLLKGRRFEQLNIILDIFNAKATGKQAGGDTFKQHAKAILKAIGDERAWDLFLNKFTLIEEDLREAAIQSQVLLGITALDRLLDHLEGSDEMSDRVRLVRIITEIGPRAIGKISTRIERGGAWYYLRNLVALLGKIGGPEEVAALQPLLDHADFRIRREALNSIYTVGGERRGPVLLGALSAATDDEKASIVAMLGALKYGESVAALLKILGSKPGMDAGTRAQLFEKTCIALGRIGAVEAIPNLEKVSQEGGPFKKAYPPKVQEAARKAVVLIKRATTAKPATPPQTEKKRPARAKAPLPEPPSAPAAVKAAEPKAAEPVDDREARIDEYVAAGDTDAAVKLLFELVVASAKKKNFKRAEQLRDRLYDVDAMALTEIVKAGEIIEAEKAESIDQDHLDVWPELYDRLTGEEATALFHAMEEMSCETDQTIFEQGRTNENLYFITQGRLKLVYRDGERETLLKTYEKGDLAGHATFFTISMCTTSLITLSSVKMSVLPRAAMEAWENDLPALKSKLEDYCLKLEKSRDLIKAKGMDRRKQERFNVKGKILVQLLNPKKQPMGKPFKGDFADISGGGLSFDIITSKPETARMLLGRRLGLKFLIPTQAAPLKTFQHGTVICVNYQLKNVYTIHVSFDDELPGGIAGAVNRLKTIKTD